MQIQCRIGADIHMAYDELTSLADSYEYNVEAWQERKDGPFVVLKNIKNTIWI